MNYNIRYEDSDLKNREELKGNVGELVRKMSNYARYIVKEFKFNENVELDTMLPHIFFDINIPQPESFTLEVTIVDMQDCYARELDGDLAGDYTGENRKTMPFLTQNLDMMIEKYLNSNTTVASLRECQSISTGELYGITLQYDIEIKG